MSTEVLLKEQIEPKIRSILAESEEKVQCLLDSQLSFLYGESVIKALPCDSIRVITEMVSDASNNQTLRNLLLNTMVTSENLWAGSGCISLLVLLESSKFLQRCRKSGTKFEFDHALISKVLSENSRRVNSEEIFESVKQVVNSHYDTALAKEILEIVGSSGNANIDPKPAINTSIVVQSGYKIGVTCEDLFWSASGASIISLHNPKILCVDGIVESMSEIHRVIGRSHETGQPVVIFARGFNDDVTNTLAVNHSNGSLKVIPVIVPYDIKGVNQLVDIAVCTKNDVVSSLKGELISAIKWDDINDIDRIKINNTCVVIHNKSARKRVDLHRRHVQKKLNELLSALDFDQNIAGVESNYTDEQLQGIADSNKMQADNVRERVFSLMPFGVRVSYGKEHGSALGIRQDRLQTILRMYSQGSKYGLTDISKLNYLRLHPVTEKVISRLLLAGINKVTPPSLICAFKIGITNAELMDKIGAWLTVEETK